MKWARECLLKVLPPLFQKLTVSRGRASCRTPQSAKSFFLLKAQEIFSLGNIVVSLPWSGRDTLCFLTSFAYLYPPPAAAHSFAPRRGSMPPQCGVIPLLGEMSAKQTKGCPFSEKKCHEVTKGDAVVNLKVRSTINRTFLRYPPSFREESKERVSAAWSSGRYPEFYIYIFIYQYFILKV